jgi:hypothetical protein
LRILSLVQASRRYLVEITFSGVTVLSDHQNLRVVAAGVAEEGNDRACSRMSYHLELARGAVRETHFIHVERNNLSRIGSA